MSSRQSMSSGQSKSARYSILLLMLLLSACQHVPVDVSNSDWLTDETVFALRQADFDAQNNWQYSAKVGVVTDSATEQANIIWRFSDQANDVRLFGPLGAGQVRLEFDQFGVQLSDSKGILHRSTAAEGGSATKLLYDITGLAIPVDALAYWLFVLPNPEYAFDYQLDEEGNLSTLRQLGWQIQFSDYRDYAGNQLPRRLTAVRSSYPAEGSAPYLAEGSSYPAEGSSPYLAEGSSYPAEGSGAAVTVKMVTKNWLWPSSQQVSSE